MTKLTAVQVADRDLRNCLERMDDALKQMFLSGYIRGMYSAVNEDSITDILNWRFGHEPTDDEKVNHSVHVDPEEQFSDEEADQERLDWRCKHERTDY